MTLTAESLTAQIERELARLNDRRVIAHIRERLVPPKSQMRPWDYGTPGEAYPCWFAFEDKPINAGIACCESGFGPRTPWGLMSLEGAKYPSLGMDSNWFGCFLEAYFESPSSTTLPIWRVFRRTGSDDPGTPITDEDSWEVTWEKVLRSRREQPHLRFDCDQSVYVREG
jgi:hypothetical protein